MDLPKTYDPQLAEDRWYATWEERGYFHAELDKSKAPFTIAIPPPNVTGELHVGHALNSTLQDVIVRYQRANGKAACWVPGMDHASIAVHTLIERALRRRELDDLLRETGFPVPDHDQALSRQDLGREAFVKLAWAWKERYGGKIRAQLKTLGCSCDWERERFTLDEGLSHAVRTAFVKLYEQGLIYRGTKLINWDVVAQTVLSDLEVETEENVEGELFEFAYKLAGGGEVVVATTRPETMLGDTGLAVHPDDERYKKLQGQFAQHPFLERNVPIVADAELVDPEFGTGVVKVTPAHDFNDFATGKRHDLEVISVIGPEGRMNEMAGPFAGLERFEAREAVKQKLEELGLTRGSHKHTMTLPRSQRSGTVVEPMISTQWFVKMAPLAKPALDKVHDGSVQFIPEEWTKTYNHWLENIQDWCISRQLWWGHRIPVWYKKGADPTDPANLHVATQAPPDPENWEQDEDVLDTWFSSSLWPFSILGWPQDTPEQAYFYPTAFLSTGPDIIFFWVARMMMLGLHLMEDVPFRDVYIHPLIRDAEGKKMSKSKGNVIDPLELMSAHGTDALRFTLTRLAAQGRDIKLGEDQLAMGRSFVTKLWNAARFTSMNLHGYRPGAGGAGSLYDRWITTRLDQAQARNRHSLEECRFSDAAQGLYQFVWGELCDWYIELAKQTLQGDDLEARAATQDTLVSVLSGSLLTLHPIMPFVTEEIFGALPRPDDRMLLEHRFAELSECWPRLAGRLDADEADEMDRFTEVVSRVRQVRGELGLAPQTGIRVRFPTALEGLVGRHEAGLRALLRADAWIFSDDPPPEAAAVVRAAGHALAVELDDPGILRDELKRLAKRQKILEKDLAFVARKLANPKFVERAKAEVVEAEREKHEGLAEEAGALQARLERLRSLVG